MIVEGGSEGDEKRHRPRKSRSRGRMKRGRGKHRFDAGDLGKIGMALRRRFPMNKSLRRAIVATIADNLTNIDPNIQMAAVRAGVMAERVNVASEKLPTTHQHLHLHGQAPRTIDDPAYIEFIAGRIASGHVESGNAGVLGDGRPVEAAPAPPAAQSPANGLGGTKANGHNGNGHNGKH